MKNKKISKISMVASLLVAGIVNAQEFYTCVPKKDWWIDVVREGSKRWIKIDYGIGNTELLSGKYRIRGAGAGGPEKIKEFTIENRTEIKEVCIGKSGKDSNDSSGGKGGETVCVNYEGKLSGGIFKNDSCSLLRIGDGGNKGVGKEYGCDGVKGTGKYTTTCEDRGGGGGGGGSYATIGDMEFKFSGGDGMSCSNGGKGASPDGYVIIEKLE